MKTKQQIDEKTQQLARELSQVENELTEARAKLKSAAGNQDPKAGELAAAVMVLEARHISLQEAQTQNEADAKARADYMQTREYKQAQKQLAELESYFANEVGAIRAELYSLADRVQKALARLDEYKTTVRVACVDLDSSNKTIRVSGNDDVRYLREIGGVLLQRQEQQKFTDGVRQDAQARAARIKALA